MNKVRRVAAVNKEIKHRTGAAIGRGLVGGMMGWPMGAVGVFLGGPASMMVGLTSAIIGFTTTNHVSDVTFEAEFEDGRRLLATTNTATYIKLLAAAFDYKPPEKRARLADDRHERDHGVEANSITKFLPIVAGVCVLVGIFNSSPLAWGIAVGAGVFIFGSKIVRRSNDDDFGETPNRTNMQEKKGSTIVDFWQSQDRAQRLALISVAFMAVVICVSLIIRKPDAIVAVSAPEAVNADALCRTALAYYDRVSHGRAFQMVCSDFSVNGNTAHVGINQEGYALHSLEWRMLAGKDEIVLHFDGGTWRAIGESINGGPIR